MRDLEERVIAKCDEIALERYGLEFTDLSNAMQSKVFGDAEKAVADDLADLGDAIHDRLREHRNGHEPTFWDELELLNRQGK